MEGAPCVVTPHNLAGFSSKFSTTLSTCSQISFPVVVEERLAIYKNSSTILKSGVAALIKMTSSAVSQMSVLSSKTRLKASHNFNLSFKVSLMLYKRLFILNETVKRKRLVCSSKCFFSGHAYSVNIVQHYLINSPSVKGFPFYVIHSQSLKLTFVNSSKFFLQVLKTPCCFSMKFFKCSILSTRA